MSERREVWVEFGDGSVAKYGAQDEELADLLGKFQSAGVPCRIWIDGCLWTPPEESESAHIDD